MTIPTPESENQEPSQVAQKKEGNYEQNLRKLAKSLEEERAQRARMEQEMSQMKEALSSRRNQDQDSDDSEPYVDEKKLNRRLDRFADDFDKKLDKKVEERAAQLIERERQQAFLKSNPDFHDILNDETVLNKLAERHPEIIEPLLEMPNNFARQKLVYQNIKALGVHKPDVPKASIQDKIDANRRSPYYQPSSSTSSPPYGYQGDFSEGGKKNAYEKMKSLMGARKF